MNENPRHWYKFLHLAEYWYDTSFHTAIQMIPFKALYGRYPPSLSDYVSGSTIDSTLDMNMQHHHHMLTHLKANFQKNKIQMEKQVNKHHVDFTFQVGDLVLLKLQYYRQSTVAKRVSHKLSKRFFVPYKVIRCIGQVAYMLDLPSSLWIHPVVYVSLLRPYYGPTPTLGSHQQLLMDLTLSLYKPTVEEQAAEGCNPVTNHEVSMFSEGSKINPREKRSGLDLHAGILEEQNGRGKDRVLDSVLQENEMFPQ